VTSFQEGARIGLRDAQLRSNLGHATRAIREKRSRVVAELPDWEALRAAGAASKDAALHNLDGYLLELEDRVRARGGVVHWARDATEANRIAGDLVAATGADEVVKVKSLTTEEIGLNEALAERGIAAVETDLAALIVQLGHDAPSHILVPAIHKNRAQIRELFLRTLGVSELWTSRPRSPGRRGSTFASASSGRASGSAARTSRSLRPEPSASSSRRATDACARPCPRR